MKTNVAILALLFVTSFSASAQEPTHKDREREERPRPARV
jgi:hypothetical protein